jgi:hypothetical protein
LYKHAYHVLIILHGAGEVEQATVVDAHVVEDALHPPEEDGRLGFEVFLI